MPETQGRGARREPTARRGDRGRGRHRAGRRGGVRRAGRHRHRRGRPRRRAAAAATAGSTARAIVADLGDERCAEVIEQAARQAGPVDVLVNAAGIYPATPLDAMTAAAWDRVQQVNVRAPVLLTVALARAGRPAAVVNISSGAATRARPGAAHYCTSKAALEMATKACAVELAGRGIRVNAVAPGFVEVDSPVNPVTDDVRRRGVGQPDRARGAGPPRWRPPSSGSRATRPGFVTGAVLRVDGGATAGTAELPLHHPPRHRAAGRGPLSGGATIVRPYVIVGAGAIGGTLGHHLARAGHPVTVVDADPEHVRRIARGRPRRRARRRTRSAARVAQAVTPDPDERAPRARAGAARGEGAGHRPGAGLDRAPAGRRRVRRVAAERAERGRRSRAGSVGTARSARS